MTKEQVHFAVDAYAAVVNVCILEIWTGGPLILLYIILNDRFLWSLLVILCQYSAANDNEFIAVVRESDLVMWVLEYRLRHFLDIDTSRHGGAGAYVPALNPRNLVIPNSEADFITLSIDDFELLKAISDGCRVHEEDRIRRAV